MFNNVLVAFAMLFFALCSSGCTGAAPESPDHNYPSVPPVWIVEDDPDQTIWERKDLQRDRKVGTTLVIPLYMGYEHKDETDDLAIGHPFVYQPGEDIEIQLASLGQRNRLRRLIFWVPGYFPNGLGRMFRSVFPINGKKMVVIQLQPCVGAEELAINAAMRTLLLEGDFVVGRKIIPRVPPAGTRVTSEPYDANLLVRSMEYNGRFYDDGSVTNIHVLWGFGPGTRIVNRLSAEDKKAVAKFAAATAHGVVVQRTFSAGTTGKRSPKKGESGAGENP